MKIIFLTWVALLAWAAPLNAEPRYTGSASCSCHRMQLGDWERSLHAKAFNLLKPGRRKAAKKRAGLKPDVDYSTYPMCYKCHVTGYRSAGGFVSAKETPEMLGVGCEMCHGKGSEYKNLHKNKGLTFKRDEARALGQTYATLDAKVCLNCHDNPKNPFKGKLDKKYKFVLEEALLKTKTFHKRYPLTGQH